MADVEKLLQEFIEEDRAGGAADPLDYLQRAEGTDRAELETLIDGYLARAPRRPFDRDAFIRSPARAVAEELGRALGGASGTWPALLPRLRHRAQLRRSDVVARLASELGAGRDQADKVARYYHEMEQGLLPASGVSDRVLEALGAIVGASAAALRGAGRDVGGAAGAVSPAVFARTGPAFEDVDADARFEGAPIEAWDAVDQLFRGG
jgi:choline dehydrogenase-like flavoprotein